MSGDIKKGVATYVASGRDGLWTGPEFVCDQRRMWILSYSVPFFSYTYGQLRFKVIRNSKTARSEHEYAGFEMN